MWYDFSFWIGKLILPQICENLLGFVIFQIITQLAVSKKHNTFERKTCTVDFFINFGKHHFARSTVSNIRYLPARSLNQNF